MGRNFFFFELRSCWLCGDEVKETGELWLVMHCVIWFEVTTVTSSQQTELAVIWIHTVFIDDELIAMIDSASGDDLRGVLRQRGEDKAALRRAGGVGEQKQRGGGGAGEG